MEKRLLLMVFASALALLLLSGCASIPASERLVKTAVTVPKYANPADPSSFVCLEVPGDKPCYCMFCENKTSWLSSASAWYKPWTWFDTTLEKGSCRFEECNQTIFADSLSANDNLQSRVFMVGQGPSFSSTDAANLYCNYSLQLATKWMIGGRGVAPGVPAKERAACWLAQNILPLYIYYTNGTAIDPVRTGEIAQALDGAGPALVTTEVNFNSSNPAAVAAVKGQIEAIHNSCSKCLTVLAVKSGDTQALQKIFGMPGEATDPAKPYKKYYDMVDAVGFGFRANDYAECRAEVPVGYNFLFSRQVLRNYSKPTIWLYAGASEGKNMDGSCSWDAQKVHNFYQNIFAISDAMANSGIIGVSFYELFDRAGPLPCNGTEGCDFGLLKADGSQKHPELNSWSGLCSEFGTVGFRSPLVFSRNSYGSSCSFMTNDRMLLRNPVELNTASGLQYSEVASLERGKGIPPGCGEACISAEAMPDEDIYDATGKSFDKSHCSAYPKIDQAADDADISATYFKAIVEQESGFNPQAVKCVAEGSRACNTGRPTSDADARNYYTVSELCQIAGIAPDKCPADCPAGQKPCGMGLSQCIDYPGKVYAQNGQSLPSAVAACGAEGYNPFDPSMSICCGVKKFRSYLDEAGRYIKSGWSELSRCDNGMADADKPWAAYYLASNEYYGSEWQMGNNFRDKRDESESCGGEQNYIKYLRNRGPADQYGPNNEYGAQVMSRYIAAADKCGSSCPST